MSEEGLRERLSRLEDENARLRAAASPQTDISVSQGKRHPLRSFASVLCLLIAALLIPVSVVTSWASLRLVDEAAFVDTFAPLASDVTVQDAIIVQITDMIDSAVDIDGLTNIVFDGIGELGLPSRATDALNLLRGPAANGAHNMLERGVTEFVQSELFAAAWETSLRMSHRALIATVEGSALNGALTVSDQGEIAIQLRPVLEQVQSALVDSGFTLLAAVPSFSSLNPSITIAQSSALPMITTVYLIANIVSWWLPLIALASIFAGVLLAIRRPRAILGSGIVIALGGGLVLAGIAVGDVLLRGSSSGTAVSATAVSVIFDQTIAGMRSTSRVLIVLGIAVAILGWMRGSSRPARAFRGFLAQINNSWGARLAQHGFSSGGFGRWIARNDAVVMIVVLIGAVAALIWLPFTPVTIFWVSVSALLVWWGLTLCGSVVSELKPDDSTESAVQSVEHN